MKKVKIFMSAIAMIAALAMVGCSNPAGGGTTEEKIVTDYDGTYLVAKTGENDTAAAGVKWEIKSGKFELKLPQGTETPAAPKIIYMLVDGGKIKGEAAGIKTDMGSWKILENKNIELNIGGQTFELKKVNPGEKPGGQTGDDTGTEIPTEVEVTGTASTISFGELIFYKNGERGLEVIGTIKAENGKATITFNDKTKGTEELLIAEAPVPAELKDFIGIEDLSKAKVYAMGTELPTTVKVSMRDGGFNITGAKYVFELENDELVGVSSNIIPVYGLFISANDGNYTAKLDGYEYIDQYSDPNDIMPDMIILSKDMSFGFYNKESFTMAADGTSSDVYNITFSDEKTGTITIGDGINDIDLILMIGEDEFMFNCISSEGPVVPGPEDGTEGQGETEEQTGKEIDDLTMDMYFTALQSLSIQDPGIMTEDNGAQLEFSINPVDGNCVTYTILGATEDDNTYEDYIYKKAITTADGVVIQFEDEVGNISEMTYKNVSPTEGNFTFNEKIFTIDPSYIKPFIFVNTEDDKDRIILNWDYLYGWWDGKKFSISVNADDSVTIVYLKDNATQDCKIVYGGPYEDLPVAITVTVGGANYTYKLNDLSEISEETIEYLNGMYLITLNDSETITIAEGETFTPTGISFAIVDPDLNQSTGEFFATTSQSSNVSGDTSEKPNEPEFAYLADYVPNKDGTVTLKIKLAVAGSTDNPSEPELIDAGEIVLSDMTETTCTLVGSITVPAEACKTINSKEFTISMNYTNASMVRVGDF